MPPRATTTPPEPILNGDFYPEIDPAAAREAMRLDGTVTEHTRLRLALVEAIASTNCDLNKWRGADQQDAGHSRLSEVPSSNPSDSLSVNVHHYTHAVYCLATALINERYKNYDTQAGPRLVSIDTMIDDLRRDARFSIRNILGVTHTTVELI